MYKAQVRSLVGNRDPTCHMVRPKKKKRTGEGQRARRHQGSAFESVCLLPVPRAFHHLLREFFLDDMTDHKDAEYSAAKPRSLDTQVRTTPNLGLIRKLLNPSPSPGVPFLASSSYSGSRTHRSISEPQTLKKPLKKDPGSELPSDT